MPTDLESEAVRKIVVAANQIIADAFALYAKTKDFHRHLSGANFRDYHLLFDEQAADVFNSIDPLAECVRRIGGTTVRSVSHIAELQTIRDDSNDFVPSAKMIAELIADNLPTVRQQRAAIEICEDQREQCDRAMFCRIFSTKPNGASGFSAKPE